MRAPRRWHLALALLTVVFMSMGLTQAARDAPTVDEGTDLVASLVTVQKHDLRINPEHGALHHAIAGVLPVLIADPLLPETAAYEDGRWFDYVDDVISRNDDAGRLSGTLFWFRVVPLVVGAAAAWVIFLLGRRVGGDGGGCLAAGLWLTTPYVLGLAHLGSLDVSFAFAVLCLALAIVRDLEQPSTGRVVVVAVALGAALATRHSAVVLVPVALAAVVWVRRTKRSEAYRSAAVLLVVPVVAVWGLYRSLDPVPVDGPPAERFDALIASASASGPLERATLAVPMPVEWEAGFAYLAVTSDDRPAYLLGRAWEGDRPWFFPVSAAVKLPLSASAAVLAGIVTAALWYRRRVVHVVCAALAGVLAVFLLVQPLQLGLRLALPVLALAFVVTASLALVAWRRWVQASLGVVAACQLVAMGVAHPVSLAWTPPPFSDGYRAVSDSSIDFGQAYFSLREAHEEQPFAAVSIASTRGLGQLDGAVSVVDADPSELVGRVAVGATTLMVLARDELSWLRAYCPVSAIDQSVLVYEFAEPPEFSPGPATPAAPCEGSVSQR